MNKSDWTWDGFKLTNMFLAAIFQKMCFQFYGPFSLKVHFNYQTQDFFFFPGLLQQCWTKFDLQKIGDVEASLCHLYLKSHMQKVWITFSKGVMRTH